MTGEAGHMLHNENPNQEGHIWGSMRRTAFILGSSLLLLMAHWNCVIGHFQRFGDASSYFWQAQWERLLSTFEGKEWLLYILGVTQVPLLVYWTFSGLLLVVDVTGKPNFTSRYRIQVDNKGRKTRKKHDEWTVPIAATVYLSTLLNMWVDQCYAALGMLDYLHGTDIMFKQTKAYKRHMILLGFTPLSESILNPLKMID